MSWGEPRPPARGDKARWPAAGRDPGPGGPRRAEAARPPAGFPAARGSELCGATPGAETSPPAPPHLAEGKAAPPARGREAGAGCGASPAPNAGSPLPAPPAPNGGDAARREAARGVPACPPRCRREVSYATGADVPLT